VHVDLALLLHALPGVCMHGTTYCARFFSMHFDLGGVWYCSPCFATPLHRMLVKQVELWQLRSQKKCRVESNSTILLEQQNRCSRKNSFQRRHRVVGKLPTMPSIMKKRFTVSSTAVCLTHSLPSTSNRSTSTSLT
jgi:hypothetical protein